jgi:spore coat polysaccharide biosynthesis protein SpsF (cytidylyltransferase family)
MLVTPLAIVQARMGSVRLPGKVILPVNGDPLVIRAWKIAGVAVGRPNVVVAYPDTPENMPLRDILAHYGATGFAWKGKEADVLGRFYACAHAYRWHPQTPILRVTPDDPWKTPEAMRRVLAGERLPVELGGEAFTLAQLDFANGATSDPWVREHITHALFRVPPPVAPPRQDGLPWSIDMVGDYERVRQVHDWPEGTCGNG